MKPIRPLPDIPVKQMQARVRDKPAEFLSGIPWLAPRPPEDEELKALHAAALALFAEYEKTGKPFVLYLRTFAIRQLYGHKLDKDGNLVDESTALVLEEHLHRLLAPRGVGVIKIADTSTPDVFGGRVPALVLDQDKWFPAVKTLIASAELIVSECQFLNPGVLAELKACIELGRADRTVLILPSPPVEFYGKPEDIEPFARATYQHDLNWEFPAKSVVFRDLVARIGRIGAMDPAKRIRLIRQGRLDEAEPVTFLGVPTGLLRLAGAYARKKNVNATYLVGARAALAAQSAYGLGRSLQYLLRVADLSVEAGTTELAITVLDDIWKTTSAKEAELGAAAVRRLRTTIRRRRIKWLGMLFEPLLQEGKAEELWRLANSQAGYALQRRDDAVLAQCFAWMAVAAVYDEQYKLGKDSAQDAIMFAHRCRDKFREGFASVYLGHALRQLGETREAAKAYASALRLLPKGKCGRIHAVAMLSMAEVTEKLGMPGPAAEIFASALTLAHGMKFPDIEAAADEGLRRVKAAAGTLPVAAPGTDDG
jgi:tetratricopeptide (TPR) repeat protein